MKEEIENRLEHLKEKQKQSCSDEKVINDPSFSEWQRFHERRKILQLFYDAMYGD